MGAHDSGVERHILIVAIFRQSLEDTLENTALTPPSKARVGILPIAEALRKIAPRNACAIAVEHGLDKEAVVRRSPANMAFAAGKKILDPFPLIVSQSIATHRSAPNQADLLGITQSVHLVDSFHDVGSEEARSVALALASVRRSVGSRTGAPHGRVLTVPRFQPPPRRTQRADFPLYAPPSASCRGLWDLSCRGDFQPVASHSIAVEQLQGAMQPRPTPSRPAEAPSFLSESPETPGRFSLRLDVYSPPQVLQIDGRLYHLVLAFPMLETLQMAGPLGSTDITPLHRYYGPSRHPLVFGRLPGFAGYTTYLAPAISRRDEEGFSSCSACPCHRAVAFTPPR